MKKIIFALFVLLVILGCKSTEMPKVDTFVPQLEDSLPKVRTDTPVQQPVDEIRTKEVVETVPATTARVKVQNFAFNPDVVRINLGDTVEWEQVDDVSHTITLVSGPEEFDSGLLRKGDKWRHTFTIPGEYEYKCSPHPSMRGKIIVE